MSEFLLLFFLFYMWHGMGVTIGYHRLLSHRSFTCTRIAEYFWVLGGYLAFEGSPIWWATIHRAHHKYDDTPLDPHSPKYGLFNAHVGWLLKPGYEPHINPEEQCKDLNVDPIYRFLEQGGNWRRAHVLAFSLGLAFRVVILACFGWTAALASLLAGLTVLQVPLLLNVVCHIRSLGYRTYNVPDDSVNVWWVSLLTFGEGWHNNHHAGPGSAKTGIKLFEFDPSWLMILAMNKLGLVRRVHVMAPARLSEKWQSKKARRPEELVSSGSRAGSR